MKYILRWSLKNIERPKKKKQSTHLKRLKKHYFNPWNFILFGPCNFLILYIISNFIFIISLSFLRQDRKPYEKSRKREKAVEKPYLSYKNINLGVNKFIWKNKVQYKWFEDFILLEKINYNSRYIFLFNFGFLWPIRRYFGLEMI
jgi:hypothetical protein